MLQDDDRELPDESDRDGDSADDSVDTSSCPHCGRQVYEFADTCHYCRGIVPGQDAPPRYPLWVIIGAVVCLLIVIFVWNHV